MRRKLYASAIAATMLGGGVTSGLLMSAPASAEVTPIPYVCQSQPGSPIATGGNWPQGELLQVCLQTPIYTGNITVDTANGGYVIAQSPSGYIGLSGHDGGIVQGSGQYDTVGPNTLVFP